ncbi:MAG TPA: M20/M25/M40 family metallo-hydrolase [Vulgatibacter sp.]|nr:M20/M25/M40 family metallo-hydrolase [Vulgatibacter sp.]
MPAAEGLPPDLEQDALDLLVELLRIDTTNPPGNERPAAEVCAARLRADGLAPLLLEGAPGRTNLVCRWTGTGEERPLLLTAHLDVVEAKEGWSHPPFGGEIHDGFVWGRGAIDMKHHAAMCVAVMRALARSGARLRRDVILALVADEEAGCDLGSTWLVENHPDLVRAEYAIGEIGGFTLHLEGRRFYPIQVAQKGVLWIRARTRGDPGHGSMPREESAVGALATAVERLVRHPLPIHPTATSRVFLRTVAGELGGVKGFALRALASPRLAPAVLRAMPDRTLARSLRAVLSNTANPTVLRAGEKINVIPSEAEALIDGRSLPGRAGARILEEMRAVLGPEVELEVLREARALECPFDTPMYETLAAAVRRADPTGIPVPYMIPGFTDALPFSRLGATWYGFAPVGLPPGVPFADLFHGRDERIPVEGFRFGLRLLFDAVRSFCAPP